jgi:hypothetical protein
MGVVNLWNILQNAKSTMDLKNELKNKALAIDLSIWICESMLIKNSSDNNLLLRTVFFRSKYLLEMGCTLVFVTYVLAYFLLMS